MFKQRKFLIVSLAVLGTLLAVAIFISPAITHAGGIAGIGFSIVRQNNANNGNNSNNKNTYRATATITGLNSVSVVASTMFVVDANGKTITTDANPYGVAIVPNAAAKLTGGLKPGDLVVTNFGANQTGKTIVSVPNRQGPAHLLNTTMDKGTNGPADLAFNTLTGSSWVANTSGNNIQAFNSNGKVIVTLTNPLFNMPWGQAFNGGVRNPNDGAVASFFSTNAANATIDRIDLVPTSTGAFAFKVFQIGQLAHMGKQTFVALTWVPFLRVGNDSYKDVLLATDTVNNRIAAYPNSSTRHTVNTRSTNQGETVFKGMPLQGPVGITVSPTTGDLIVANSQKNDIVELNVRTHQVVGDVLVDNVPVDAQSGNGSALFGVAAGVDKEGNLQVYFTDDNTNTVNVLHRS